MRHKNGVIFVAALSLLFLVVNATFGEVSIGVQKGDWIEYKVTTTGNPEEGHDVTWARLEILNRKGTEVRVNITTKARNGTYWNEVEVFDPAIGNVGIWFLIPANLNPGDQFFDASLGRNVTIEGSEERIIAGATRTVTFSSTTSRYKSWDKVTGVFVETVDALENTTLYAIADKTNLWSGETVSVGTLTFYNGVFGIAIGEAVIILALLFVLARLRTKQQRKQ
jgi:hypothetical protein